ANRVQSELTEAQAEAALGLADLGAKLVPAHFPALKRSFDLWSTAMGEAEGSSAFLKLLGYSRRRELLPHLFRPAGLGGEHTLPAVLLGLVEDVGSIFPQRTARFTAMRHALREELIEAIGDGVLLYPP